MKSIMSPASLAHRITISKVTLTALVAAAGCISTPITMPAASAADQSPESTSSAPLTHGQIGMSHDPSIPTPESVVGHAMGVGAVRYDPAIRYLRALADASPFVTMTPYAQSHEGRTLYFLTITSEANHARLDEIKADNAKLADPRQLADQTQAERILDSLPGIAWLAYSIHGDELSSTDAAVQLAYQLAAGTDEATRRLRNELVIHIDPMMNPDGRERYLGQLQHLTGKVPNPDYQTMQHSGLWSAGRGNHYLFDLNRDWLMQVHPETRGRAAKIIEWNPHLVVDSHEMGSLDTYLFDPPREPISAHLSEQNLTWRRRFSGDQAKAFDLHGWSYYTQEWYEEWYPGYTNAWASLQGAIGILYEQAGVNGAAIKQPAGNVLTYREAVRHQFVSSLANLESLRTNRRDILHDFLEDQKWAVAADRSGSETLIVSPASDRARLARFIELLGRQGIELGIARSGFAARDVVDIWGAKSETLQMPTGSLIVRAAQPHRRLLDALLDFDPRMTDSFLHDERKDLENRRGTRVYDVTAWNLCMAYGLTAYWAKDVPAVDTFPPRQPAPVRTEGTPGYGYLIDGAGSDIYRAVVRLLDAGYKVRVATEPFAVSGHAYERGTVLLRGNENTDRLPQAIREAVVDLDVDVRGTDTALSDSGPDLGGRRFGLLEQPRLALASQFPMSSTSFGAMWHLLDARIGLRVSPVNIQRLGRMDLRKYNVIVLPNSWGARMLSAVLNKGSIKRLKQWIEAGGTLVAVGGSAAFVAGKDRGLSSVRLRRDVLDQLAVYDEALEREKNARDIQIDSSELWGTAPPHTDEDDSDESESESESESDTKPKAKRSPKDDNDALKRKDKWQRLFSPSGVIARAQLDVDHWLCSGVASSTIAENKLSLLIMGRNAFMSKYPARTPVRLAGKEQLRLSGLLWPEARQRLADSAYVTIERVGNGQIILFATDPFYRGYFEGTGRIFLNALIFGPGLGASQAVPW